MILVNIFQVAMLGKNPKQPTTLCINTVYFLLKIPDL